MFDIGLLLFVFGIAMINFVLCEVLEHFDKNYYKRYMNLATFLIIMLKILPQIYNLYNKAIEAFGRF